MVPWYTLVIAVLVGIGLGYGFRAVINREGKELLQEVKELKAKIAEKF